MEMIVDASDLQCAQEVHHIEEDHTEITERMREICGTITATVDNLLRLERTQRGEVDRLRKENTILKKQLEAVRAAFSRVKAELDAARTELDAIAGY